MALITRFSRLFRADMHAVLDRVEEPDILLRQSIREMEEDVERDEQRSKALQHDLSQIGLRQSDLARSLAEIEGELDVCFESGEEDLARAVVRRKLQTEQLDRALDGKRRSMEGSLAALAARVAENRGRLSLMRQRSALVSEHGPVDRNAETWPGSPPAISDEEVEVALLAEKRRRSRS